jgi:hypothetical protein
MEAHAGRKQWTFDKMIRLSYAEDMITYVKAFDARWLAVVDRKGLGELYDMEENCSASKFRLSEHDGATITGMVLYRDANNTDMILASIKNRRHVDCCLLYGLRDYVTLNTPDDAIVCLDMQHRTSLFYAQPDARIVAIDITWSALENRDRKRPVHLLESEIVCTSHQERPLSDGLIVTDHDCLLYDGAQRWKRLTGDMFLDETIDSDARKRLMSDYRTYPDANGVCVENTALCCIKCYHRTTDESLYTGHDWGMVACWK